MGTIRGRLTAWYATALTLTLTGFAVALYIARRSSSYEELDRRIESEAELTAGILGGVHRAGGVGARGARSLPAALHGRADAAVRHPHGIPDRLVDRPSGRGAGGPDHDRGARDLGRPQPAPAAPRADRARRARSAGGNAEPD